MRGYEEVSSLSFLSSSFSSYLSPIPYFKPDLKETKPQKTRHATQLDGSQTRTTATPSPKPAKFPQKKQNKMFLEKNKGN